MCTGAEIAILGLGAASTASALMQKPPSMPAVPELAKPPEAAKTPARDPYAQMNKKSAAGQGPSSTALTGPGGVDPTTLSLGRSSLYDSEKSKLGA